LTAPGKTSHTPTVATVSMAPSGFGRRLERQNQLRRRCQRVFAARHQLAARMPALAFDVDAQAGRRGNVRHQANVDSFRLKVGALLDMQLDKLVKASRGSATDSSGP
jgi:hypothetical protein